MPQIIVTADGASDRGGSVMLRERVNVADFDSDRFASNLVERLGWAVSDAVEAERDGSASDPEPADGNLAHAEHSKVPQPA